MDVTLDISPTVSKMSFGLLRFIYPIKTFYWCWSVLTIKIATMILILGENYPISSYSLAYKHFLQILEFRLIQTDSESIDYRLSELFLSIAFSIGLGCCKSLVPCFSGPHGASGRKAAGDSLTR